MSTERILSVLLLTATTVHGAASIQSLDDLARQSLSKIEGRIDVPGLLEPVEVIRDKWGVPHIYAKNTDDLFFAQGFVQAQDRLWQMEMWRRFNAGRLAEVMGPAGVEHDRMLRLIQYQGPWDDQEFESYHPEAKRIFTAFANGVNAYIRESRDNLPIEFKLTGIAPEPWTLQDVVLRVPARSLDGARSELRFALQVAKLGAAEANRRARPDPFVELTVPRGLDVSLIPAEALKALEATLPTVPFPRPPLLPQYQGLTGAVASLDFGTRENAPGSNNWVVSGTRTASGRVLLANDPHRQVANPSLRYIVHLNAPGWDVIGATEPAIPGVAIGHNGRIGWGLTIVGTDYDDVFVEEINPNDSNQARWQGEWYPLRVERDTIRVRGQAPQTVERKYSRHGPIFYEDRVNHRAYALRSTLQERGTAEYLGGLRLNQASLTPNCREFLKQQRYYLAPSENMICGDVDGNIAWHASALTPRRAGGWDGRLPVPGTGAYKWDGFRDDLPYEYNPERGWIATANHNIHPKGYYPPLFFKRAPYVRWDRLKQIFSSARDLRVEDFERLQHDNYWPYLDEEKALLRGWTSPDPDVEWARQQIVGWDGRYERDSVAPSLHNYWRRRLEAEGPRSALEQAASDLRKELGADRTTWRWGRLHKSEFPHWLVKAFDLPAVERSGGGGTVAATGATYREIIDFSDLDNSRTINTPGQSGQPGSPFYDNLRVPWGEQKFFPLRYSRKAVDEAAAYRLTLRPRT